MEFLDIVRARDIIEKAIMIRSPFGGEQKKGKGRINTPEKPLVTDAGSFLKIVEAEKRNVKNG